MLKIPVSAIGQIDEGIVCVSDYQLVIRNENFDSNQY